MIEKIVIVKNSQGLHARPSAVLVELAGKFASDIKIIKDEFEVDAKSIMGIMMLAAAQGTELKFVFSGTDEQEACLAIEKIFDEGFNE
ncbi:MAG: HPr family phosphocarrier protein [Elusimicrobia bacterium]|nr:HPr family phosphocarrier protein [Elusimicrobiota bacterium]